MMAAAVVFSFAVAYIAHRGVVGATSVNIAINVIQISALVVFAVMALGYRSSHPAGHPRLAIRFQLGRRVHLRIRHHEDHGKWRRHG